MILAKKAYLLVSIAILTNTLTVVSLPANYQPTKRTLQTLPDGMYFYSNVRLAKQPNSEYIILRKSGRSFIYYGYVYQSDGGCGAGTIRGNTLNRTRTYTPLESDKVVENNFSINLDEYYQLSDQYISTEDREGIQGCINIMSR